MNHPVFWGALFALCLVLGAGPGTSLVNQAEAWFGWPRLYVWGVSWWVLLVVVLLGIDRRFWKKSASRDDG